MSINIHGTNIDTGETLRGFAEETIRRVGEKYYGAVISADVFMEKVAAGYEANIRMRVQRGIGFQASARADDPYAAMREASENIDKQMRRTKRIEQSQVRRREPMGGAVA